MRTNIYIVDITEIIIPDYDLNATQEVLIKLTFADVHGSLSKPK